MMGPLKLAPYYVQNLGVPGSVIETESCLLGRSQEKKFHQLKIFIMEDQSINIIILSIYIAPILGVSLGCLVNYLVNRHKG